jgi:hypothetical protein
METGKSSANSGGKKSSALFFRLVCPGRPSSMTWSLETTEPPPGASVFCAKLMTGAALPPSCSAVKAAACASSAWLRACSTLYSCMKPLTSCGRSGAPGAMPTSTHHFSVGSTR